MYQAECRNRIIVNTIDEKDPYEVSTEDREVWFEVEFFVADLYTEAARRLWSIIRLLCG